MNLTALIGKNGSGKSAVLEFLTIYLSNLQNLDTVKGFILLYEEKNKTFYIRQYGINRSIKLNEKIEKLFKIKELKNQDLLRNTYSININYAIDYPSTKFWNLLSINGIRFNQIFYINKNLNFIFTPIKSWNRINVEIIFKSLSNDYFYIKRVLKYSDNQVENLIKESFEEENFIFYPNKFKLELNKVRYIIELEGNIKKNIDLNFLFNIFEEQGFNLFKLDKKNMETTKLKLALLGIFYIYIKYERFLEKNDVDNLIVKFLKNFYAYSKNKNLNSLEKLRNSVSRIKELSLIELKEIKEQLYKNYYIYKYDKPVIEYLDYVFNEKQSIDAFLSFVEYKPFKDFLITKLPTFININMKDKNERLISDLSFGEKLLNFLLFKLLRIFLEIEERFKENINTLNIIYDEFDIGIHPEMQRRFIKFILKVAKLLKESSERNLSFNMIISTHSPFIVSDVPKDNILFMESGNRIKPLGKNENTFGANLYDILDKGFFVKNSIGSYSEEFIKILSTILLFVLGILSYEKRNEDFLLKKLLEEQNISKNLENLNLQNYKDLINGLIDENFKEFFINQKAETITDYVNMKRIKYFIENLIGEPVMKKNLIKILEEISILSGE